MTTYCTGNTIMKRKLFRSYGGNGETVYVDNDEILATFELGQKLYCVAGDIPYGNMTIEQFVACSRSLVTKLPLKRNSVKLLLQKAGLKYSVQKKMRNLTRIEYRTICLISKIDETTKSIYVNFDGLEYDRKNGNQLKKFVSTWQNDYEVYISISDSRFIPSKANTLNYTSDSIEKKEVKMRNKIVRRFSLKKRLARVGMDIKIPNIKTVVECSQQTAMAGIK